MSNHLAIATVTAALRQVLDDATKDRLPGVQAEVVTGRPGGKDPDPPTVGVGIYLYQVAPNGAWRNADLPTRRTDGHLIQRPQAALDLHYLLSFYGKESELQQQRLLGIVVRALHAQPTLPRAKIREVINANTFLGGSDMADAIEAVRFTPLPLSLEELSKLWSVFATTPYALSVAYQGMVVLIEADEPPQPLLPVRARNLYVTTFHQPVIDEVLSQARADQPIGPDSTLVLRGTRLRGDVTRVRIGGEEVEPASVTDREITVPLSLVPTGRLRAGVQGVQVVHPTLMGTPPAPHSGVESQAAPFILHPKIHDRANDPANPNYEISFAAGNSAAVPPVLPTVTVRVVPEVGKAQRAVLLLNRINTQTPATYQFAASRRSADGEVITFAVPGVESGTYLVRVQVDGADSPLETDATNGRFFRPRLVIP